MKERQVFASVIYVGAGMALVNASETTSDSLFLQARQLQDTGEIEEENTNKTFEKEHNDVKWLVAFFLLFCLLAGLCFGLVFTIKKFCCNDKKSQKSQGNSITQDYNEQRDVSSARGSEKSPLGSPKNKKEAKGVNKINSVKNNKDNEDANVKQTIELKSDSKKKVEDDFITDKG